MDPTPLGIFKLSKMLGSIAGLAGGLYHLYKFGKRAHDAYKGFSGTHLGKMVNSGIQKVGARVGSSLKSVGHKVGGVLKDFGKAAVQTSWDRLKRGDLNGAINPATVAMEAAYRTYRNRTGGGATPIKSAPDNVIPRPPRRPMAALPGPSGGPANHWSHI